MKALHMAAYILLWVGGLNWGLWGLLNMNLVETLLGMDLAKFVYILVGVATVYVIATHMKDCKVCAKS
ncbi:hypothetical protein A3F00_03640 [Candidatus Daviesbacteria bacterium RIFCSPHIGHO2_12_FULL_37_11]|uniref:DUF378 domain-containing protein n=1 Tax=Candidatus Daviesbacteria bacterium RIFCSPHIGHO2_12_FULL_37_11 TaxID=1797777 RepID=A0A1F5KD83_9BACT|nr:MAG: hypothetical protein A2769_01000 [Candidatus Daviesbacteria bacterium RIFCSPHIGHO2_01_FULL_37_27]OGE38735.1 MAG: hypothetical protein A3F00_03640 [Candidatus Daviesbacteria bacterium RIFCSPHIGHO2_12_FULL_37_11]OGE45824.1 MAG: hypothetical protein A3B39_01180 [Candidatus Daviesbacteria bacterium RIFCSPLOWO2_01_FULL_37_10]